MPWIWTIAPHTFESPDTPPSVYSAGLYSGAWGEWYNNPKAVGEVDKGPCPPGTWVGIGVEDSPTTGNFTIILVPDPATTKYVESLGRNPYSFRLHGDSIAAPGHASEGCLIAPRLVREAFWSSPDHKIIVRGYPVNVPPPQPPPPVIT